MAAHRITISGKQFYEDEYRLTTRELDVAVRYLGDIVRDLDRAGVGQEQITIRAELDTAPYTVEIEVYVTDRQAAALGWQLDEATEAA
jgi:hypothetical protein